jgi:hypothetical protein
MQMTRYLYTLLLASTLGCLAPGLARAQEIGRFEVSRPRGHAPLESFPSGRVVTMYVIGHSQCSPSNRAEFFETLRTVTALVADRAANREAAFRVVGVAVDWSATDGLRFLEKLGPLDEVVAGSSWLNSAAIEHVLRRPGGSMSTPQLIVVETAVLPLEERISVSPSTVLASIVGLNEIEAWVRRGAEFDASEAEK